MPHTIHSLAPSSDRPRQLTIGYDPNLPNPELMTVSEIQKSGKKMKSGSLIHQQIGATKEADEAIAKIPVAPTQALRAHILSMSLFPNIYQK